MGRAHAGCRICASDVTLHSRTRSFRKAMGLDKVIIACDERIAAKVASGTQQAVVHTQ